MDFTFSPEADDAAALAATILGDHTKPARLAEVEAAGNRFDPVLWTALGDAGLLTLTTPEAHDGAGLGFVELCRVLVEVGRTVAPVPLATDSVARLLLGEHGSDEQQRIGYASDVLSCAIAEEHEHAADDTDDHRGRRRRHVRADRHQVPRPRRHGRHRLPGDRDDDRRDRGLPRRRQRGWASASSTSATATSPALIELDGVRVAADRRIGDSAAAQRLLDLLTVASCAVQLGVTEGAVALTAEYAKTREQFDRPVATFQAVSQRLADGYIDTRFLALTVWQAAWRLAEHLPAEEAVATAKLWAADAGHRIAHTTVHIHGGVGVDLDGVAHRYFTAATRYEFQYGGATEQALRLGRRLAAEPA